MVNSSEVPPRHSRLRQFYQYFRLGSVVVPLIPSALPPQSLDNALSQEVDVSNLYPPYMQESGNVQNESKPTYTRVNWGQFLWDDNLVDVRHYEDLILKYANGWDEPYTLNYHLGNPIPQNSLP